jgi:acetyl-CoA acyltransferase
MGTTIHNVRTSNVAREAALVAGIPGKAPANTVTLACISANLAITHGIEAIQTGQAEVVIAGGTDSVSDIPIMFPKKMRKKLFAAQKLKSPGEFLKFITSLRFSDFKPEIPDITEYTTGLTMGQDCDILAARMQVTREEQDEFALRSHHLAAEAIEKGELDKEVVPVEIPPKFKKIEKDNGPRGDSSLEKLNKLRPAFDKKNGTLTAANSSFLTDGAAVVLIMTEEKARELGMKPKARIVNYTFTGQDPKQELLLGPAYATPKVLSKSGLSLADIDVFEYHEAFAGQLLANIKALDSDEFAREHLELDQKVGRIPLEKLNTRGGSLSLGHPFGATGARLVTTAMNRLIDENKKYALIAACAGGAHGHGMIIQNYN